MRRSRSIASVLLGLLGIAVAGFALPTPVLAQYPYLCAPGYYYDPYYGCVLLNYNYVPPYYAYPAFGYDYFYGGGWGGYYGHGGGSIARGGVPHGGAPHGGTFYAAAPHGSGGHNGVHGAR